MMDPRIARYSHHGDREPDTPPLVLHRLPSYQANTRGRSDVDHRHDDFDQIIYLSDRGIHHMDFQRFECSAHAIGLIPVGAVHRFDADHLVAGWVVHVCADAWPAIAAISRVRAVALNRSPFGPLPERWRPLIEHMFEMIHVEASSPATSTHDGLLTTLLGLVSEALAVQTFSAHSPLVVRFLELVEGTFRSPLRIGTYAKRLGVSGRTLHEATQQQLGHHAPSHLVQQRRLLEAKRLLSRSAKNVSEVAAALGFSDPGYFTRFFRKHTGSSPLDFRASRDVADAEPL